MGASVSSREAQNITMNVCVPSDYEFQILKAVYLFKLTNKRGRQNLWGFPELEITRQIFRNIYTESPGEIFLMLFLLKSGKLILGHPV